MNEEFREEVDLLIQRESAKFSERRIVFYGSSSFRRWETLEQDLPGFETLNVAFGGSTILDTFEYYDKLLRAVTPEKIFYYAGDNDIGQGEDVNSVFSRFKQFYTRMRRDYPEVPFTFLSIKPSPERALFLEIILDVNKLVEAYLEEETNSNYIDIYFLMMNGEQVDGTLFCEDQLHMNEKGYSIWKEAILKELT